MTLLQKINSLIWFDLINKLKSIFTDIEKNQISPNLGLVNFRLESINGVLTLTEFE